MQFQERLHQKQRDAATRALLDAIVEDPNQTINDITQSLADDKDASYFAEVFSELTLGELWVSTLAAVVEGRVTLDSITKSSKRDDVSRMFESLAAGIRNAGELESVEGLVEGAAGDEGDDNEFAEPEAQQAEPEQDKPAPKRGKGKGKGKGKSKGKGKGAKSKAKKAPPKATKPTKPKKGSDESLDLSDPEIRKTYRKSVLAYLKANDCTSFESGASAQDIRKTVGGDPKQLRDVLGELMEQEKVTYDGQARGTKYFLL